MIKKRKRKKKCNLTKKTTTKQAVINKRKIRKGNWKIKQKLRIKPSLRKRIYPKPKKEIKPEIELIEKVWSEQDTYYKEDLTPVNDNIQGEPIDSEKKAILHDENSDTSNKQKPLEYNDEKTEELLPPIKQKNNNKKTDKTNKTNQNKITTNQKIGIAIVVIGFIVVIATVLIISNVRKEEIKKQLDLGESYLDEGKYDEAILAFDAALKINDKEIDAFNGKGDVYLAMNDMKKAEETIELVQDIKKTNYNQAQLAEVYFKTKREDEAKKITDTLKTVSFDDIKGVTRTAYVMTGLKDYDGAIGVIEKRIDQTDDKDELKKLFDKDIQYYIDTGKTEDEIQAIIDKAIKKTGDDSYKKKKEELAVKKPTFDTDPGEYDHKLYVEVIKGAEKDTVYYTTDDSDPTDSSNVYDGAISINKGTMTIKVVEYNTKGIKGKVQEATYTVTMSDEEVFLDNIEGRWINGSDYFEFGGNNFEWGSVGHDYAKGSLSLVDVNKDGISGTIAIYQPDNENMPLRLRPNPQNLDVDCGITGDGLIYINGAPYTYLGN